MDEAILGVVNEVPEPKLVPPVKFAYQLIVPALAVAVRVTVPVPHLEPGVVEAIVGIALTVAKTAVLVAVIHPSLVVEST